MYQIYKISVAPGISYDCIGDNALELKCNDKVVVRCEKYQEYATISECKCIEPFDNIEEFEERRSRQNKGRHIEGQKMPQVIRIATPEDYQQAKANELRADEAHVKTIECIQKHNLDMKLILTHYALDGKMLIFQFLADGRIDFRELLRDLSSMFHVRVELRQVGVRDEASILGGIGTCGRQLCCTCFLHSITSVNVKMAKQQGLSLNPQSISGCCGRLKCCLQYESDEYAKEQPKKKQEGEEAQKPQPQHSGNAKAQSGADRGNGQGNGKRPGQPMPPKQHKQGNDGRRPQQGGQPQRNGNAPQQQKQRPPKQHNRPQQGQGNARPILPSTPLADIATGAPRPQPTTPPQAPAPASNGQQPSAGAIFLNE